jgi:hypothetical protein
MINILLALLGAELSLLVASEFTDLGLKRRKNENVW